MDAQTAPIAEPTGLRFTEEMKGFVALGETDPERGYAAGRRGRTALAVRLTIRIEDVERFLADAAHEAAAEGHVACEALGGDLPVLDGRFNLFVDDGGPTRKQMRYRLHVHDGGDHPLTLLGTKTVVEDAGFDVWRDTSTLYTRLVRGHVDHVGQGEEPGTEVVAAGIISIHLLDFLQQLTTFRTEGGSAADRATALTRFGSFFLGQLWDVYGPRD